MREREGEQWYQVPINAGPEDFCGCVKPAGCVGKHGWHWTADGAAYEPCPAYRAASKKNNRAPRRAHYHKRRTRKGGVTERPKR